MRRNKHGGGKALRSKSICNLKTIKTVTSSYELKPKKVLPNRWRLPMWEGNTGQLCENNICSTAVPA